MSVQRAWLAGLLDGEGAFYLSKKRQTGRAIYTADVRVEMVDEKTIDRIAEIYSDLKIDFTKKSLPMKNPKHRPRHILWLRGLRSVHVLCTQLVPFLVTKKEHAQVLVAFSGARLKAAHRTHRDPKGRMIRTYTGVEEPIYKLLRRMNKRGT